MPNANTYLQVHGEARSARQHQTFENILVWFSCGCRSLSLLRSLMIKILMMATRSDQPQWLSLVSH